MNDFVAIMVGIVLANELALPRLPGPVPFLGQGAEPRAALGTTAAIVLTLLPTAAIFLLADAFLLVPFEHTELRLLASTVIVVAVAPVVEAAVGYPGSPIAPGKAPWPPHIVVNCAMLAGALAVTGRFATLASAMAWAAGTGAGFGLLMAACAESRRRLRAGDVPQPFRGAAITLITGGMLSLALQGLSGLLRN